MAKASWVTVSPASGNGNKSVSVSASAYTGRVARTTILTFSAANCEDVTRNVVQAGKPETSTYDDDTAAVPKEGKTITITGVTNSSKLTFALGNGDLDITLPDTYLANSVSTANGATITGDPGASAEFPFSISIVVPENKTINVKSKQLLLTDNAGNSIICVISIAEGDPYLTVTTGDINLPYAGTAKSISVTSNTTWTIS